MGAKLCLMLPVTCHLFSFTFPLNCLCGVIQKNNSFVDFMVLKEAYIELIQCKFVCKLSQFCVHVFIQKL